MCAYQNPSSAEIIMTEDAILMPETLPDKKPSLPEINISDDAAVIPQTISDQKPFPSEINMCNDEAAMPLTLSDEKSFSSEVNLSNAVAKSPPLKTPTLLQSHFQPSLSLSMNVANSYIRQPTLIDKHSQTTFTLPTVPPRICPHSMTNQQLSATIQSSSSEPALSSTLPLHFQDPTQTVFNKVAVMPQVVQHEIDTSLKMRINTKIRSILSRVIGKHGEDSANVLPNQLTAFYAQPISIKAEKGIFAQKSTEDNTPSLHNTMPKVEPSSCQHLANQVDSITTDLEPAPTQTPGPLQKPDLVVKLPDNSANLLNTNYVDIRSETGKKNCDLDMNQEEHKRRRPRKKTFSDIRKGKPRCNVINLCRVKKNKVNIHSEAPTLNKIPASIASKTTSDADSHLGKVNRILCTKTPKNKVVSAGKPRGNGNKIKCLPSTSSNCTRRQEVETIGPRASDLHSNVADAANKTVPCDNYVVNRTLRTKIYTKKPREYPNKMKDFPSTSMTCTNQLEKEKMYPSAPNIDKIVTGAAHKTLSDEKTHLENVDQDGMLTPEDGTKSKCVEDKKQNITCAIDTGETCASSVTHYDPLLPEPEHLLPEPEPFHYSTQSVVPRAEEKCNRIFQCTVCSRSFPSLSSSIKHLNSHTDKEVLSRPKEKVEKLKSLCDICGKTFLTRSYLRKHIELEHYCLRPFRCGHCIHEKSYATKNGLLYHIQCQHVPSELPCVLCNRVFRSRRHLRNHMRVHSGRPSVARKKRINCPACPKTFAANSNFVDHLRSHTGETPFKCSYCPRKFSLYWNSVQHERIHTREKRYNCDKCGKAFIYNVSRKKHMMKCRKDKKEVCSGEGCDE